MTDNIVQNEPRMSCKRKKTNRYQEMCKGVAYSSKNSRLTRKTDMHVGLQ